MFSPPMDNSPGKVVPKIRVSKYSMQNKALHKKKLRSLSQYHAL